MLTVLSRRRRLRDVESKVQLKERLAKVKEEAKRLELLEKKLLKTPDKQLSLTDPDARIMATRGRSSVMVGYNVQSAVDTKSHLIMTHEVTNIGNDRAQLSNMAKQAKAILEVEKLDVLADRGYYSGVEILACDEDDITTYLPKTHTSGNKAAGLYDRSEFIYDAKTNTYRCPAAACPKKSQCTTGVHRRMRRWEHEYVIDKLDKRMANEPRRMGTRRSTVEHPFGTIKSWMGHTHFQMKTMPRVATEMSLHVLSYNLKRVISILGVQNLISAIEA